MAEPTDPAELAALKAYDDAYVKLVELQEHLPSPDSKGAVDAWVLNVHSLWKIVGANWQKAGVSSRAWRGVETELVETIPKIHEDSIAVAFTEYNELVARARRNEIIIYPLPIPDRLVHQKTPANQARSQVSSSPAQSRPKSVAPPPNLAPQSPKQTIPPILPATPPRQVSPAPVIPKEKTPIPPLPRAPSPNTNPRPAGSFPAKPPTGPSFMDLCAEDLGLGSSSAGNYSSALFRRPGWGSPAWSSSPASDDGPPSPSRSSFGLSFGPAALLPSPQISKTGTSSATQPSRSGLFTVDAASRPQVLLGPDPVRQQEGTIPSTLHTRESLFLPGTDDEEEQSRGIVVNEERVDDEDSVFHGQEDDAPTLPVDDPMDVDKEPVQQSDGAPSPPPSKVHWKKAKISFVFNAATGDFEPYPTIFLPRPSTSLTQAPRRSDRPHASSVSPDAAYLQAAQGSKPNLKKNKKDAKGKAKVTESAPSLKCTRDSNGGQVVGEPAPKKSKVQETVMISDDESVAPTKAFRKRGPAPAKPPAVTLGVSGGGFGEQVPSTAKAIKSGLESIGALEVEVDFGDFVQVDGCYWNKEVAPFVGERYTESCDHCKRLGTQCRKFLTNTVICVRCHYAKLPCKVKGIAALNPLSHYRPKSYRNLNAFTGALDTLDQHADALEDQIISYMAGLNVLTQINGLRVQAGCLRECAVYNGGSDEEDGSDGDDEDEVEVVPEGVAGPSKKKKSKSG
ncbi:uncharacterized protein ARMOST_20420 [Armillaria ostoyae]|uniref:Zn(2)-C6 fungal-type domain-containing protein n=1 Tax=Armillaria ostoyae TaxID=47428 RepID=A0A284S7B2_ARMOS|nr:uncharacterized protein ARMOST_20420 [Armillaria ostoyae]